MTAIGIDRFRQMLQRLLEKCRDNGAEWYHDPVEKCYCFDFQGKDQISVYHHAPPESPEVAGALLHVNGELVITLEAEEGEDDWPLLSQLYRAAERSQDTDHGEIAALERQLQADQSVGAAPNARPVRAPKSRAAFSTEPPSLEDLEDGDSPFDDDYD